MKPRTQNLLIFLGLLLAGVVVYFFGSILLYLVVSAVLSLIGRPIVNFLGKVHIKRYYLPDAVKALIALLLMLGILTLLIRVSVPSVLGQAEKLEELDVAAIQEGLQEPISWAENIMQTYDLVDGEMSLEAYLREKVLSVVNTTRLSNIGNAIVGFTGDFFIALFAILFITFFFLKERTLLYRMILTPIPKPYLEKTRNVLQDVKELLTRYFIGVLGEVLLVGLLISLGLTLIGLEDAFVIGIFAGLFNIIPYLGPIIGIVFGLSLTVLGNLDLEFYTMLLPLSLKVLVVFTVVQLIDNLVFQPLIYSSSVKAHPLEIFLVILMAGNIAGVGGMILAIPAYTILRVIAKEFFDKFQVIQSLTSRM